VNAGSDILRFLGDTFFLEDVLLGDLVFDAILLCCIVLYYCTYIIFNFIYKKNRNSLLDKIGINKTISTLSHVFTQNKRIKRFKTKPQNNILNGALLDNKQYIIFWYGVSHLYDRLLSGTI
jgi:hypothetical protein